MAGGAERVVGASMARLIDRGALQLQTYRKDDTIAGAKCRRTEIEIDPQQLHTVERVCLSACPLGEEVDVRLIHTHVANAITEIPRRLKNAGLLLRPGEVPVFRAMAFTVMVVLLVAGLSRLSYGHSAGHAVEVLAALSSGTGTLVALLLFLLISESSELSPFGSAVLTDLRARNRVFENGHPVATQSEPSAAAPVAFSLTLAFALFGSQVVVADDRFDGIDFLSRKNSADTTGNFNSAAGCGGCGGGGCGG